LFQKNNSAQLILNENYFNWLNAITQKCGQSKDQQIRSCFLHTKLYYNNINMTEASPSNYLFPSTFNKIIGYETPNISVSFFYLIKCLLNLIKLNNGQYMVIFGINSYIQKKIYI